jgi:diaminohydroxyphosphoribosylaminopyrimidine deaminase/5-amino-6-(5-phosphoribosylamino)uracil reductase
MKSDKDEFFMRKALALAKKARPSPNPRVGAIIVKNSRIAGIGFHRKAGEPHAEINAIRDAKRKNSDLSGCTLYVTLEPCCHTNKRTPPCTNAILAEKIGKVVIAAKDPNPHVSGRGISLLKRRGVAVKQGILEREAEEMNEGYNFFIRKKKPLVVLKAAISLDGKIATERGDSKWISNEKSRRIVHQMRTKYDAILAGIGTVRKDNPKLTSRIAGGIDPLRVIIDSQLGIPPSANVLKDRNVVIFTSERCDRKKKAWLAGRGYDVVVAGKKEVSLREALPVLAELGLTSVLVEGGARIFDSFLRQKLADKIVLFVAPIIIGGKNAPSLLQRGAGRIKDAIKLESAKYTVVGDNIMVEGWLDKSE